jgi:hypothetical protein
VPDFADVRTGDARALAHEFLRQAPAGGWLSPGQTADLLGYYGIPLAAGEDMSADSAARAGGTDVMIRVVADHVFGPLVTVGHAARLTPLTDTDADQLIQGVAQGKTYLRDLLLRVSRLADDLPAVASLELGPVIAGRDGVVVLAARIKAAPYEPQDPFLRKLR